MRVLTSAQAVLCDFRTGYKQQAVLPHRARRLRADVFEVPAERLLTNPEGAASQRRNPSGAGKEVLLHQDVIGDRDHVELPRRPVQVDHLSDREVPVAPARVDVKVAEQERLVPGHQVLTSRCTVSFGR